MSGIFSPPLRSHLELVIDSRIDFFVIACRRFAPDPRHVPKKLFDQLHQIIDSVVMEAMFGPRENIEIAAKIQDVPRVNARPTIDRPQQQLENLFRNHGR